MIKPRKTICSYYNPVTFTAMSLIEGERPDPFPLYTVYVAFGCVNSTTWMWSYFSNVLFWMWTIWCLVSDLFNAESQCCQCLFTYTHISSNVPNVVEVCVCGFVFLQTEVPTHGGLAEVTKSTSTGVVRHQESRNAPVESNAIAQTPNSTVTVMLITNSGEWIHCLTHLIVVHLFFVRHQIKKGFHMVAKTRSD